MATTRVRFDHGSYTVEYDVIPAEPEVGIWGPSIEVMSVRDAGGVETDDAAIAEREDCAAESIEGAVLAACEAHETELTFARYAR